jgi:LmbE family N-acetylglucosaminyl deacetylase
VLVLGDGLLGAISSILCVGAHSDDIEIGCGGTMWKLLDANPGLTVHWVVLSAVGERAAEARASAERFLAGAARPTVEVETFRERYFPYLPEVKEYFDALAGRTQPDLIFTHRRDDAHQDHRVVAELTFNTYRDHLILEYEIPKYDGDLGRPNVFVTLDESLARRKVRAVVEGFPSQAHRDWFAEETFLGLLRLRGVEARSPGGYAEAFQIRKLVLA